MAVIHDQSHKQHLLDAAVQLFAQKGYDGATLKEIADRARANVALISYHFGGKEGLYREILESLVQDRLSATERMLRPVSSEEEFKIHLKLFIEELIQAHFKSPYLMKIVHRDFDGDNQMVFEIFKGSFHKIFLNIKSFLQHAIDKKILRQNIDSECAATILIGGLVHSLRTDFLRKKLFGKTLTGKKYADHFIEQLLMNFMDGTLK